MKVEKFIYLPCNMEFYYVKNVHRGHHMMRSTKNLQLELHLIYEKNVTLGLWRSRKLSHRKVDRAMRPISGALKIFESS